MANHTTGAQRYNNRMDKIFEKAKSEGRGLVGNSHVDGAGVNSPAMKAARSKALEAKKGTKSKCENCGGNHKNHSSYVYKTGNL